MKKLVPLIAATLALASPAAAQTASLSVTGIQSQVESGEPGVTTRTLNIGAGSTLNTVSYSVNYTAFDPSYLSEAGIAFGSTSNPYSYSFFFAANDGAPGSGSYSGLIDLTGAGADFSVDSDGLLVVSFFEDFDDSSVNPDGQYNSGNLGFAYSAAATPEPASWAMMVGGFGVAGGALRSRRRRALRTA